MAVSILLSIVTVTVLFFIYTASGYLYNGSILSISHSPIADQDLAGPMGVACNSGWCYRLVNIAGRIAAAPWTFSVFPGRHQGNTFGPLLLRVLPFSVFVKVPRKIRLPLILMGIFMAQSLFMEILFIQAMTSIRYSMPIYILGATLIVWTVRQLSDCSGWLIIIKR